MLLPSLRPDSKTSFQPFRLGFFLLVPPPPLPVRPGATLNTRKEAKGRGGLKGLLDSTDASRESSKSPPPSPSFASKNGIQVQRGEGEGKRRKRQISHPGKKNRRRGSQASVLVCAFCSSLSLSLFLHNPFFVPPPLFLFPT